MRLPLRRVLFGFAAGAAAGWVASLLRSPKTTEAGSSAWRAERLPQEEFGDAPGAEPAASTPTPDSVPAAPVESAAAAPESAAPAPRKPAPRKPAPRKAAPRKAAPRKAAEGAVDAAAAPRKVAKPATPRPRKHVPPPVEG